MSKSDDKPHKAVVDLNKLKRPSDVLYAELVEQIIIPEMLRILEDKGVSVTHPVSFRDSSGFNILVLTATGNRPNGFQQRATAAATAALRNTFTKRAAS